MLLKFFQKNRRAENTSKLYKPSITLIPISDKDNKENKIKVNIPDNTDINFLNEILAN